MVAGLQVEHLSVHYPGGTAPAVDDATFSVAPGEIVGLLGPSGSGKSSLLGAVLGVVPATQGTVTFDGQDLTGVPTHRRDFGMVFQDGQLFPNLSVAGNIAFGLAMRRASATARQERVHELLELVGLSGFQDREVAELSGGERQRVALARSLAPQPRLLALDEPLSSLDATLRERLGHDVRQILKTTRTTSIFVTHDSDEAHQLCDRLLHIDGGRLST